MAGSRNGKRSGDQAPWLERLLHLLHDPPGKVKYLAYHQRFSQELTEALTGLTWTEEEWKEDLVNRPDVVAAGADRPCFRWGLRQAFSKVHQQLVTHPLGRHGETWPLLLASSAEPPLEGKATGIAERQAQREAVKRLLGAELAPQGDYEGLFYRAWRRWREELVAGEAPRDPGSDEALARERIEGVPRQLFWSAIPADTRCPDVSIWDHTRVTAALAFMNVPTSTKRRPTRVDPAREPWLLQLSLGGVQGFIRTARTSRDLWVGSFLLADLSFHAMLPIIERYGPVAILYPDLWRNPRMEAWLAGSDGGEQSRSHADWSALPSHAETTSFAAVVPSSFVAVVPAGGAEGMPTVRELADAGRDRVAARWEGHAAVVRGFLDRLEMPDGLWRSMWERQHEHHDAVRTRWAAVPWVHSPRMRKFVQSGALPWQDRQELPREDPKDEELRRERSARFEPWLSQAQWDNAERTRYAFGSHDAGQVQRERGFDYAATNAQLRVVHQVRKHAAVWPRPRSAVEGGVKCSLCGERSALTLAPAPGDRAGHIDSLTGKAREFWSHQELDPERSGAERLCGICTTKRFLVKAGRATEGLNALWANARDRDEIAREGEARVPFPSTAAVCAQGYLGRLCRSSDPQVLEAMARVVETHRALGWPPTQFPRCLRQLGEVYQSLPEGDVRREFLKREPQELLYPEAIQARLRMQASKQARAEREQAPALSHPQREYRDHPHVQAVRSLLKTAKDALGLSPPGSHLAMIKVDGDSLGSLLTGEPGRIHARWEDVIHPELVAKLRKGGHPDNEMWSALLPAERMMGPSLHAFVTRALGEFAHRIAPWIVEQEFNGRLIYVGGDDLLALAPASEALAIVARLNQLFSAHWIVDTTPQRDAWAWRRLVAQRTPLDRLVARDRFVIPLAGPGRETVELPATWIELHSASEQAQRGTSRALAPLPAVGPVIPMLGAGHSLSAGIVYAHFKDSLGHLVAEAERLVDEDAKARLGRDAVAFSWRSRRGEKLRFAMHWRWPPGSTGQGDAQATLVVPPAQTFARVASAFAKGELSKGLPYELAERSLAAQVIACREGPGRLPSPEVLRNLLPSGALGSQEGSSASDRDTLRDQAVALWRAGFEGAWASDDRRSARERAGRAADGLRLCRELANEIPEGEV